MRWKNYIRLFVIILGTTIASIVLNQLGVDKENILMIFIVGVLLVTAFTRGYSFGIIASCASVMMFNYFFTEPLYTFAISDSNDIALMFFFLVASMISSSLTARFQRQFLISQKNEQTAKLLYEVTQRLLNVTGEENIIYQGIRYIKEYTGHESVVELKDNRQFCSKDNYIAVIGEKVTEVSIMGIAAQLGMLRIYHKNEDLSMEQEWLLNTVAAQMGIALDREFVYNERENTRIAMEREHLKSNLLRSIGHDLRTPLAGIAGASSYIVQKCESLDKTSISSLAGDINEQAVWLTTLVENILNMTRIENDKLEVNKQIEVIDDVVSEAVTHVVGLNKRTFKIALPQEVVAIPMDGKMIVQVLVNLLDNAVKHTSKESPIELMINQMDGYVEFNIADGGAGLEHQAAMNENLFGAFVTSRKTGADGKKGLGLGLAICKAVVEAHGGSITTGTSHLGGALFTFTLPNAEVD